MAHRGRRGAASLHRGRRVAPAADLGHGHRQPRPDRRRLPRGVPDEPGATTSCRPSPTAPAQPAYEDIALERGVTAHRPFTGGDVLPSTAWHAEFADVNNDGLTDLFVAKGNVEAEPDYAARDPSNLLIGQPDGTFEEGAEEAGIVSYERARGAALVDLNLDGLLDLVVVNRRRARRAVAQRRRAATPTSPSRWAPGLALRLAPAGVQRRRHRRVGRGPGRRPHAPSARSRSAAGTPAASSAGSTSGSATAGRGRGPRAVARRRDRSRG